MPALCKLFSQISYKKKPEEYKMAYKLHLRVIIRTSCRFKTWMKAFTRSEMRYKRSKRRGRGETHSVVAVNMIR